MILSNAEQKRIITAVDEAVKLLKENPTWTYKKAIAKAKELIK